MAVMLFAIVLLFFFPLTFGSFQSTHGPTTTVSASSGSIDFTFDLVIAALVVVLAASFELSTSDASSSSNDPEIAAFSELLCCLRC